MSGLLFYLSSALHGAGAANRPMQQRPRVQFSIDRHMALPALHLLCALYRTGGGPCQRAVLALCTCVARCVPSGDERAGSIPLQTVDMRCMQVKINRKNFGQGSSESSSTLTEQRVASGACTQKRGGGGRRILKITVEGMDNHWTGKRRCCGDGSADGGQQQQRVQSESRISLVKQACNMLNELGFTPAKDIRNSNNHWLQFGQFVRFQPLYESAYQEPIRSAKIIYVCEFCLAHMVDIDKFRSHVMFCQWRYPPGNEIYRNVQERWNIWEVEGNTETAYCRNLCLMAKLFLSSKTMYHEVETFTFYLLTEITSRGCVLVGYFSKEKNPSKNNNLSCLLTLPNTRNRGYGKLLIDLSYQLSKLEHKIGHPEHPLSDMGLMAYRSYWRSVLFCALRQRCKSAEVSIKDLSIETAIHSYDIVTTLSAIDMLLFRNDSYYIDNTKALNASLASLRRRHIFLDQLRWRPPFEVYPHSSKMNSMILDELPAELLPSVYRHIPGDFLWTNVRPVCRRMNNSIRRNEYWLRRLNIFYGLQLTPRLRAVPAEQQQQHQHSAEEGPANLMPSLRCVATERRAASLPFARRQDEEAHIATIDALRLFSDSAAGDASPDRVLCLSGARDRQIVLRACNARRNLSSSTHNEPPAIEEIARIDNAHNGWIWCISVVPDGQQFYSAGWDSRIQQWNIAESRIEHGLRLDCNSLAALCCVTEGQNVLYASTYRRGPILYDFRVGTQPQHELNMHGNSAVIELATGPNCNQLFSIGDDNRLVSLDKRQFSTLLGEHHAPVSHIDYADGQLCLSLKTGQLRFFDPTTLELENELAIADTGQGPYNVIRLTRGATFCATSDNMLRMYTPGLRPRLIASTELDANVTRLDVLNGAVVAALSTGCLAYYSGS
ncbi:hypothetical protein GPALN_004107 [Globodera pallida]|nr:hypothetical protein GPALN_004107 [Globodera pallida]